MPPVISAVSEEVSRTVRPPRRNALPLLPLIFSGAADVSFRMKTLLDGLISTESPSPPTAPPCQLPGALHRYLVSGVFATLLVQVAPLANVADAPVNTPHTMQSLASLL